MQNKTYTINGLSEETPFSSEASFLISIHPSINLLDFSERYLADTSKPMILRFLHNAENSIIDCSMFRACTIVSITEKGLLGQFYVVSGDSNFSISTQQSYLLIIPKSFPKFFDEKSRLQFDMNCFNPYKRDTVNELVAAYNRDLHTRGFVSSRLAYKLLLNEAIEQSKLDLSRVFILDEFGIVERIKRAEIKLNENGAGLIFSEDE
jgi:hypothetical protein